MAFSQEKYIRVPVLEVLPGAQDSQKIFNHWEKMLDNFLTAVAASVPSTSSSSSSSSLTINKLAILNGYLSPDIYALIKHLTTYETAIEALRKLYKKKKNVIYARHLLVTTSQESGESATDYSQRLLLLAKDCVFEAVTAEQHKSEAVRDALIAGLKSPNVRLRLLENDDLTLEKAIQIADSLERAQLFSSSFEHTAMSPSLLSSVQKMEENDEERKTYARERSYFSRQDASAVVFGKEKKHATEAHIRCYYCGNQHPQLRKLCPAKNAECFRCGRRGHFAKVCRAGMKEVQSAAMTSPSTYLAAVSKPLEQSTISVKIDGVKTHALVDSGASECYVSSSLADSLGLWPTGPKSTITLASKDQTAKVLGYTTALVTIKGHEYRNVKFGVVSKLCADVILGLKFLEKHKRVIFEFDGENDFTISNKRCSVAAAKVSEPPAIFKFVDPKVRPVAVKSRNYSSEDRGFIRSEIEKLLKNGVIENSVSPWRAQVVVTKDTRHKKG